MSLLGHQGKKQLWIHEIEPVAGNSGKYIKNAGNYTTVYLIELMDIIQRVSRGKMYFYFFMFTKGKELISWLEESQEQVPCSRKSIFFLS